MKIVWKNEKPIKSRNLYRWLQTKLLLDAVIPMDETENNGSVDVYDGPI